MSFLSDYGQADIRGFDAWLLLRVLKLDLNWCEAIVPNFAYIFISGLPSIWECHIHFGLTRKTFRVTANTNTYSMCEYIWRRAFFIVIKLSKPYVCSL